MAVKVVKFKNYKESVPELLDSLNFDSILKQNKKKIILKPNLTLNRKPPVTTPTGFVEEVIKYIKKHCENEIIIAEGSGGDETETCFNSLGYIELAERYNLNLIDLNKEETQIISKSEFKRFKSIGYPKILLDSFLISLPVLKEHDEATVTIALKNMLGAYPKRDWRTNWKREMHQWHIDYSIHDIIACRFPDFAICDASIGQTGNEIYGKPKKFGILIAGDTMDVEKKGCEILGYGWEDIRHIVFVDDLHGNLM